MKYIYHKYKVHGISLCATCIQVFVFMTNYWDYEEIIIVYKVTSIILLVRLANENRRVWHNDYEGFSDDSERVATQLRNKLSYRY